MVHMKAHHQQKSRERNVIPYQKEGETIWKGKLCLGVVVQGLTKSSERIVVRWKMRRQWRNYNRRALKIKGECRRGSWS